jgi:ABC-2 type transport system ATP-binding protein
MEEAQRLCDRVLILDHGKILAMGTPRELIEKYCPQKSIEFIVDDATSLESLEVEALSTREIKANHIQVKIKPLNIDQTLLDITTLQAQKKLSFNELRIETQNLEDVFLELTGRRIRK